MNKEEIKQYMLSNSHLISVKFQAPGKTVLKYKPKVFYKALWTPELCEMRGTVVNDKFDIVQRPFTKIFNVGEKCAPFIADEVSCYASRKINGFMAAATWHMGEVFVSTTGSIISDFAILAKTHLMQYADTFKEHSAFTFIFEIVDKSDPHVIVEELGVYLVGMRIKSWGSTNHDLSEIALDSIAFDAGIKRPEWYLDTFINILNGSRAVQHEGFVIYVEHWIEETRDTRKVYREVKVKSPFYLATKFLGRKSEKRLTEILNNPRIAKTIMDEEFFVVIDYLATMKEDFISMNEQERFAFLREYFMTHVL